MTQLEPKGTSAGEPGNVLAGWWHPGSQLPSVPPANMREALLRIRHSLFMVEREGSLVPELGGTCVLGDDPGTAGSLPVAGHAPPCLPENLGDRSFCADLGIRYPYLGGSMAKGISSAAMVEELGRAGMLGFFGAAGLSLATVEEAVDRLTLVPTSPSGST